MRGTFRFVAALVLLLGLVTWGASVIVRRTTGDWFENDLRLRSQLAVTGARQDLVSSWGATSRGKLLRLLTELTRDERIFPLSLIARRSAERSL